LRIWIFTAAEPQRFGGYRANTPLLSNPKIKKMSFFFHFFHFLKKTIENITIFFFSLFLFLPFLRHVARSQVGQCTIQLFTDPANTGYSQSFPAK